MKLVTKVNAVKSAKKYKNRHDWVMKVIYWELCKKFKFDRMNKWYILKPESVQKMTHTNGSPNFGQMTRPTDSKKKKEKKEKR